MRGCELGGDVTLREYFGLTGSRRPSWPLVLGTMLAIAVIVLLKVAGAPKWLGVVVPPVVIPARSLAEHRG